MAEVGRTMSEFSEWFTAMKEAEAKGERPHVGPWDIPALDGDDNLFDYADVQRWVGQDALKAMEAAPEKRMVIPSLERSKAGIRALRLAIEAAEPRCGNCRWWGDFTDAHMPERSCRAVEVSNLFDSVDEIGRNTMITKSAFGCVEWSAKDA
jgi:hypothetical protein